MTDLPPFSNSQNNHSHDPMPPTPRWVKLFGIAAVVLVIAFVVLHITGHSPDHHMP